MRIVTGGAALHRAATARRGTERSALRPHRTSQSSVRSFDFIVRWVIQLVMVVVWVGVLGGGVEKMWSVFIVSLTGKMSVRVAKMFRFDHSSATAQPRQTALVLCLRQRSGGGGQG